MNQLSDMHRAFENNMDERRGQNIVVNEDMALCIWEDAWKAALLAEHDAEQQQLLTEVESLCNLICNSPPETTIKGEIESRAFALGHFTQVLNAEQQPNAEAVWCVPIEVEGHDVLYRHQSHPEPRCDNVKLFTHAPSQVITRERLVELMQPVLKVSTYNQPQRCEHIADAILAALNPAQETKP